MKTYFKEQNVTTDRETVKVDVAALNNCGIEIYATKGTQTKYYFSNRQFELAELKLLVDAVESSKFITAKKSGELVKKLMGLTSQANATELVRHLYTSGRIKPDNEAIFLATDAIFKALSADTSVAEFVKKSHNTEEVEAESVSFAVCAYYGIATGENSFGYIASWSKDKELPELRASLETINKTSSVLITDIDRNYAVIMKERGLDKVETKQADISPSEMQQEKGLEEAPAVTAPDNGYLPDPVVSIESMNAYGYTDADMLPLSKDRALELAERDVTVYLLHPDNTEAMAFDTDEIRGFDGLFGVTLEDWDTVKDALVPAEQKRDIEAEFLSNPADVFAIYQLRDSPDVAKLRFMNTEYLAQNGLEIDRANYTPVYTGTLTDDGDEQDKLNDIYAQFNIDRPKDFTGHSLSVSDIIALKQNSAVSCHYVDSWGFKELQSFVQVPNYLKNAEMAMEDDYGMIDGIINNGPKQLTAAELEQQAKSGQPISLLDYVDAVRRESTPQEPEKQPEKKPSVLAKLYSPTIEKTTKTAPKRSVERELL